MVTARVDAQEVARRTALSVRAVQDMALRGDIPGAAKLGGKWTFDPLEIERWIKTQTEATQERAAKAGALQKTRTSSGATALPTLVFKSTAGKSNAAYTQAIGRKRSKG